MATATTSKPTFLERLGRWFEEFVAKPASARPLAALRIGVSLTLLLQALAIAPRLIELFGPLGVVQRTITDTFIFPGVPRVAWLVQWLSPLGISEDFLLRGVFILYMAGLSALLFGWHTRIAAVVAWLTHLLLMMSTRSSLYGVDDFAHIVLFYMMWMPVGHAWSLDLNSGRVSGAPSFAARLSLRVLQLHLCIVYLSSGIEKATTPPYQWLEGEVLWRSLMLPEFAQVDLGWLANYPWFVKLATWGTLALELAYAFLIWPRLTRVPVALSTIAMHLGIGVLMGMMSFGAIMMVLTGSVWLVSAEPRASDEP